MDLALLKQRLQEHGSRIMLWAILVGIAFFLFFMASVIAATSEIPGNVSINVTDGFCSISTNLNTSTFNASNNQTATLPLSLNATTPDYVNQSLALASGEHRLVNGCFDVLDATCTPGVVANGTKCVINATMDEGESYTKEDAVCDVHFHSGSNLITNNGSTINITRNAQVGKVGDRLTIQLDNTTVDIDLRILNASTSIPLYYTCPVTLQNFSNEADWNGMYQVCSEYMPMFTDWLNLTLHGCIGEAQGYRDFVNAHYKEVSDSNQQLSDCRASGGQKDGTITEKNAEISALKEALVDRDERQDYYVIVLSVLAFLFVASVVINFLLWGRANQED